jgi:coatomer subunit beta'
LATSLVPAVVEDWRADLTSKNRPKLAAKIAGPADQPELFAEGWKEALEKERTSSADGVLVDVY